MKEALYTLGNAVHALQKERGCASMFLSSEGTLFRKKIDAQFADSDQVLKSFVEGLDRWEKSGELKPAQLKKLRPLLDLCEALPELREKIRTQKISVSQIIDHYAHHLIGPLLQTMVEIALFMESHNPIFVSTYNAFLQWKERIGLERSIGVRGFLKQSFHNIEFLERVLFLLSEQNNYRDTYMALANDTQKQLVQEVLDGAAYIRLERLHDVLKQSPESTKLYELTPQKWFDLITATMDALQTIEKKLIDTLNDDGMSVARETKPATQSPINSFGEYDKLIASLQLFSGLSREDMDTLLRHGQIRDFSKGKLLFLEGEQANRFYIILKGWVKIYKGTAAGEETILQMLSSGDSIMESAVYLNTPFPVSAQIVENATLLSIPTPVLREQIKSNNGLALNLLASMSSRSQGLIRQIEDARLKTVDERIGWFLLQLLLEQGRLSRGVKLPYDKSLIASYLDMKRETFSRSLKRLKAKGFTIENDTIVIPDLGALCGFCGPDTAHICLLHGTSNCPNSQYPKPTAAQIQSAPSANLMT